MANAGGIETRKNGSAENELIDTHLKIAHGVNISRSTQGSTENKLVLPCATDQGVIACTAVEYVAPSVCGNEVCEGIAGSINRSASHQREVLDIGAQDKAHQSLHQIDTLPAGFGHDVPTVIDHIDIVAQATQQRIRASAAVQHIVSGISCQAVCGRTTAQVFNAQEGICIAAGNSSSCRQTGRNRGCGGAVISPVTPLAAIQRVTAGSSCQGVVARKTLQDVAARIPGNQVSDGVARTVDSSSFRQGEVFEVGPQRVGKRRNNGIRPFHTAFGDGVGNVVHYIAVVAQTARHGVRPQAAIQCVVATVAGQHIVRRATRARDGCTAG